MMNVRNNDYALIDLNNWRSKQCFMKQKYCRKKEKTIRPVAVTLHSDALNKRIAVTFKNIINH